MARPKRTKVASTGVQPRVTEPTTSSRQIRQRTSSRAQQITATPDEKSESRPGGKTDHNQASMSGSSSSKHAVQAKPQQRGRRRAVVRKQPDEAQRRALDELVKRKEEASKAQSAPQTEAASRKPATTTGGTFVPQAAETSKQMAVASPTRGRSPTERLGVGMTRDREATPPVYDLDDDLYGLSPGGEISLARLQAEMLEGTSQSKITTAPASALRIRGTPAAEASMLALANFKRRPRQASIIRQVQLASETGDRYDFDNLEPDDESTPLHLNKRKTRSSLNSQFENPSAPASSSSRKRKFSEVQVPAIQSSPLLASSPPLSIRRDDSPSLDDSPDLPERAIQSHPDNASSAGSPRIHSPTMADPRSSSSLSLPALANPSSAIERAAKLRRTSQTTQQPHQQPKRPAAARVGAGTSSTTAPTTRHAARARTAAVSTAALQSLLPKPRRHHLQGPRAAALRAKSAFDLPSDGSDGGAVDVEGERVALRERKAGSAAAARRRGRVGAPAKGQSVGVEAVKGRRTYGRGGGRGGEEKENESDAVLSDSEEESEAGEEDGAVHRARSRTREMRDVVLSKEMEAAKSKFRQVDEWEMEFECVDLGVSGSSWR